MSELQCEFGGSSDSNLNIVNPLCLIQRFFVAQVIRCVLATTYHNLNRPVVVSTCSGTAVIHNDHLLMQVSVLNYNASCDRIKVGGSSLRRRLVVSRSISIRLSSHKF
jgi:hypothetical protein